MAAAPRGALTTSLLAALLLLAAAATAAAATAAAWRRGGRAGLLRLRQLLAQVGHGGLARRQSPLRLLRLLLGERDRAAGVVLDALQLRGGEGAAEAVAEQEGGERVLAARRRRRPAVAEDVGMSLLTPRQLTEEI